MSLHKIIQKMRNATPLSLRTKIGPYIAFVFYYYNLYLKKNRFKPNVLSLEDTLDLIKTQNLSVIRFGDGEISLMENSDLGFQKKDENLAERLAAVLRANGKGLLICVPGIWNGLENLTKTAFWFILHHLFRYEHVWKENLNAGQIYGDAYISRPYLGYKDKTKSADIFSRFASLWDNRKIVLIEGGKSRIGVGNDLFSNACSVERILCPSENAYQKYEEIKNAALKIDKDKLILISLGPSAKILSYDLFKAGYRVIDIGHLDMEYEMFKRGSNEQVAVKYKYFNEIGARDPEECKDEKYLSQITVSIK